MATDKTIVDVRVISPLKVIAFVCACIAVQMLILSLLTKYWLEAEGFCQGLWEYCFVSVGNDMCSSNLDKVIILLAALVIFPVVFIYKIDEYRMAYKLTQWFFSWSYGLSWGAWIFMIGAAVLLLIDRETEEIFYTQKARCYSSEL